MAVTIRVVHQKRSIVSAAVRLISRHGLACLSFAKTSPAGKWVNRQL